HSPAPPALTPTTTSPRRPLSTQRPLPASSCHHHGLASPPTPLIFPRSALPPPLYCPRADRDASCCTRCGRRHLELDRDSVHCARRNHRSPCLAHTVTSGRSSQLVCVLGC
uniref:Uncharacterized protein n=1 Tax=Triticum urartu TaxID=4572 RepID=A0A8R7U505_TRIUA